MDLVQWLHRARHYVTKRPAWERQEGWRQIVSRINRRGLTWVAWSGIVLLTAFILVNVLFVGKDLRWRIGQAEPGDVVLMGDKLFSIAVFVLLLLASKTRAGLRWGRPLVVIAGLAVGFSWIIDDILHRDLSLSVIYLSAILAVAVGMMPFRPFQALLFSLAMLAMFLVAEHYVARLFFGYQADPSVGRYLVMVLMGILFAGISNFIYDGRYQIYRISRKAEILQQRVSEQRDRLSDLNRFIRQVFGRYLSAEVVRDLLETPEGLKVGGSRRTVTILIADIRGFSSLSESLPPEQVVNLLNVYLEGMTGVIQEYEGTIDEFIGDAIFVIFGAPVQREDDAERAVACAVAMQMDANRVNRLNRARSLPMIEIGIGIATGEAVVGNIGSIKRAKYGVVGRSVNLAARIESYTVGGQILVTEETLNAVRDMVQVGSQFIVEPKGAPEPITIYEIVGIGGRHQLSIPQPRRQLLPLYLRLPFTYVVLEEKFAGRTVYSGHVVALSDLEADLVCRDHIPLLSNLKLFFLDKDGQTVPGEIYGKITGRIDEAYLYRLRFTSLSHDARSFLDRVRATTTAA